MDCPLHRRQSHFVPVVLNYFYPLLLLVLVVVVVVVDYLIRSVLVKYHLRIHSVSYFQRHSFKKQKSFLSHVFPVCPAGKSGSVFSLLLLLVSGRAAGTFCDNELRSLCSGGYAVCSSPFVRNNSDSSNFVTRSYVYMTKWIWKFNANILGCSRPPVLMLDWNVRKKPSDDRAVPRLNYQSFVDVSQRLEFLD